MRITGLATCTTWTLYLDQSFRRCLYVTDVQSGATRTKLELILPES